MQTAEANNFKPYHERKKQNPGYLPMSEQDKGRQPGFFAVSKLHTPERLRAEPCVPVKKFVGKQGHGSEQKQHFPIGKA